jgi:hypothetical protein
MGSPKPNELNTTLKVVTITIQDVWMATRPNVYKNRKKYTRKKKHKKDSE